MTAPWTVRRELAIVIGAWSAIYVPLAFIAHYSLKTNAFDLSVFDYALWSATQGSAGAVPFMGHTLWSHHFMPTLLALLPVYVVAPRPELLIAVQLLATAVAAVLLFLLADREVPRAMRLALLFAFLFSRRSHSAVTSYFYVESLEPALVLGLIYVSLTKRSSWVFWTLAVLALGCKEDMPLYLAAFGILLALTGNRRRGLTLVVVSAVWLVVAVQVAIPAARVRDGLGAANPFIEARLGGSGETLLDAARRILSVTSLGRIATLTATTAFLCWLAPAWLAVVVPGLALNFAARSDTLQAAVLGHYFWAVLPWLFVAAVFGAAKLAARRPRFIAPAALALTMWTVVDSPLWLTFARRPWRDLRAGLEVRRNLPALGPGLVLAQPNLIPHLPHRTGLQAAGRELLPAVDPDYVVLCEVGDLWPLGSEGVRARIDRLRASPSHQLLTTPPLYVFARSWGQVWNASFNQQERHAQCRAVTPVR
ncbi:MAG TPA: DUF2079 domain-containing protein [Vicinamibacterales bacterium]|nr:DUF2079 domain-containing protein [Vicinamibacterales bacterium]